MPDDQWFTGWRVRPILWVACLVFIVAGILSIRDEVARFGGSTSATHRKGEARASAYMKRPDAKTVADAHRLIDATLKEQDANNRKGIERPLQTVDVSALPAAYAVVEQQSLFDSQVGSEETKLFIESTGEKLISVFFLMLGVIVLPCTLIIWEGMDLTNEQNKEANLKEARDQV